MQKKKKNTTKLKPKVYSTLKKNCPVILKLFALAASCASTQTPLPFPPQFVLTLLAVPFISSLDQQQQQNTPCLRGARLWENETIYMKTSQQTGMINGNRRGGRPWEKIEGRVTWMHDRRPPTEPDLVAGENINRDLCRSMTARVRWHGTWWWLNLMIMRLDAS